MRVFSLTPDGPVLGGAIPLVCVPIVASNAAELVTQAHALRQQPYAPDIVELRADHLCVEVADIPDVLRRLKETLGQISDKPPGQDHGIPILFTNRHAAEGGAGVWTEHERVASITAAAQSGHVALVDIELATPENVREAIIQQAKAAGAGVIVSAHDFTGTPDDATLADIFARLLASGGDLAKLAVSAITPDDAMRLLCATGQAARTATIPITSMAMGPYGAITRLVGPQFGSCLTYAATGIASAPGQLPLAFVREFWQQVGLRSA